jgi:hypothetical protein
MGTYGSRHDEGREGEATGDLEVMRSVELLWREEVIQIDVGLPHVLPICVNDLQEGIHPETDIGTAIHLVIVVGRGGEGGRGNGSSPRSHDSH